MNRSTLAIAAACAVAGATVASVLMPAGAEQVGGNEGSVTIGTPFSYDSSTPTRDLFPSIKSAGNIELGTPTLTARKGSTTKVSEDGSLRNVKPGTYDVTTRAKYRYVKFRRQDVPVIPEGSRIESIRGPHDPAPAGETTIELVRTTCKVTSVDPGAGRFVASCDVSYTRTVVDPPSGEYTDTNVKVGTMPLTGTYDGTNGVQDGHPDATLEIDPVVGGDVYAHDDEEANPEIDSSLYATKTFTLPYFNREAGSWHHKSKTVALRIR